MFQSPELFPTSCLSWLACLLKQARRKTNATSVVSINRTGIAAAHVKTKCTNCGKRGVFVRESRITPSTGFRRRRKECMYCGDRTTTYEVPEDFYKLASDMAFTKVVEHRRKQRELQIIRCIGCVHNDAKRERCGFDLPEHMTSDANDCLYFNQS